MHSQLCVLSVLSPFSVMINNALLNIYIQVSAWTCLHFFWLHTWEWNWYYSYSTENHKQFHCPTKNGIMQNKCCLCRRKTMQPYRPCKKKDVSVLSRFSCVRLCVTLWTVASQAPLSMGIFQARILEWVAMPSSRGSSPIQGLNLSLLSPALAGGFFTASATWEVRGKKKKKAKYDLLKILSGFPFPVLS